MNERKYGEKREYFHFHSAKGPATVKITSGGNKREERGKNVKGRLASRGEKEEEEEKMKNNEKKHRKSEYKERGNLKETLFGAIRIKRCYER